MMMIMFLFNRIRLTIGLMGLDDLHLRVLAMSSDDELERKNATKGQGKFITLQSLRILKPLKS